MSDPTLTPPRAALGAGSDTDDGDDAGFTRHDNQFVTFSVAGEMFAVPMGPVQEIIRVPEVARLPLAPAVLDGLANLRGRVLPIINLRRLFQCEPQAHDDATRAVVINLGQPLGFVVDRVASVLSVEPHEIEPASAIQSIVSADYLTGVIKRPRSDGGLDLLMTLDFGRLVDSHFAAIDRLGRDDGRGARSGEDGSDAADAQDDAGSDELRLVSFSVAGQEYGIDIADVQEIVQLPEHITALPNVAHHVLGLISLRQRLLPLVSLRGLFGLPDEDPSEHHRIVVIALPAGGQVGLVTDAVKEVLSIPRSQADAMPGILAADSQMQEFSSICRLDEGKRLVSIIATDRLLGLSGMRDALSAMASHDAAHQENTAVTTHRSEIEPDSNDDDTQVVIFRLGAEEFAVPIMSVQEIVRVPDVLTKVPKTPHFIEGVINLRGTVLPVIDQRTRLGLNAIERNDGQRIMVYLLGGLRTGFIVDSVAEVLRIPRHQIAAAPDLSDEQSRLISQVAKLDGDQRLVMLLDPNHLLQGREMQAMSRALTDSPTDEPADALARAA
ncbi:MAG: chemotaxis protein CheW [Burkholderiales bacterium]|nr:chemotaxis protein CheW [Burkholderiales bacterium]MBH2015391.1 chemotaxis protein CheW [Burkholderiales bacterium]